MANVAVRKQFQRLMEFIRDGKLHSVSGKWVGLWEGKWVGHHWMTKRSSKD